MENYCILWGNFEMNVCFEYLGGICALFYESRLGIKKGVISSGYLFCPNTGMKFCEPYHSNHVIPHREIVNLRFMNKLGIWKILMFEILTTC